MERTYLPGGRERVTHSGGTWHELSAGWFKQIVKASAFCADGKIRVLAYVGECDTFFSRPAAVRVGKVRLKGFVGTGSHALPGEEDDWQFHVMVPSQQKSPGAARLAAEWLHLQDMRDYQYYHDGKDPHCAFCGVCSDMVRYKRQEQGYCGTWYCEEHMTGKAGAA